MAGPFGFGRQLNTLEDREFKRALKGVKEKFKRSKKRKLQRLQPHSPGLIPSPDPSIDKAEFGKPLTRKGKKRRKT